MSSICKALANSTCTTARALPRHHARPTSHTTFKLLPSSSQQTLRAPVTCWASQPFESGEQQSEEPSEPIDLETVLFNAVHMGPLLKRIEQVRRGELVDEHIQQALLSRPELSELLRAAWLGSTYESKELIDWHEQQWARMRELHEEPLPLESPAGQDGQ